MIVPEDTMLIVSSVWGTTTTTPAVLTGKWGSFQGCSMVLMIACSTGNGIMVKPCKVGILTVLLSHSQHTCPWHLFLLTLNSPCWRTSLYWLWKNLERSNYWPLTQAVWLYKCFFLNMFVLGSHQAVLRVYSWWGSGTLGAAGDQTLAICFQGKCLEPVLWLQSVFSFFFCNVRSSFFVSFYLFFLFWDILSGAQGSVVRDHSWWDFKFFQDFNIPLKVWMCQRLVPSQTHLVWALVVLCPLHIYDWKSLSKGTLGRGPATGNDLVSRTLHPDSCLLKNLSWEVAPHLCEPLSFKSCW